MIARIATLSAALLIAAGSSRATVDIQQVTFKRGSPSSSQSLADSLSDSKRALYLLDGAVKALRENHKIYVEVAGYADRGECVAAACYELSSRRAYLAATYLLDKGVPASQITHISGYGTGRPLAPNPSGEHQQASNRRVEIIREH